MKYLFLILGFFAALGANVIACAGDAAAVIRNIEQNTLSRPGEFTNPEQSSGLGLDAIGILSGLNVKSDVLNNEIRSYWSEKAGKKITQSDVERFKSWAWAEFKSRGYLAWLVVDEKVNQGGVTLNIEVTAPKLGKVEIDYAKVDLSPKAKSKIDARIRENFKTNDGIDVSAMDNHIQNASFGLPVEFDARLKQVVPGITDMTISARDVETKPGVLRDALVQVNSFGLKQYGRTQGLASLSIGGFTPMSQLSMAAQVSEGVTYGRAEYQMPFSLISGQTRFYVSYADFSSVLNTATASRGDSLEYGLGVDHLIGLTRYAAIKSHLDISERHTKNELKQSGVSLSNLKSLQVRAALTIDNSKVDADQYDAGFSFVGGDNDNSGSYGKVELNGRYVKTLTEDKTLVLSSKIHGQVALSNLDSFDKISLGGVNGVRAYTSVDGVGDQGAVFNLDLIQRLPYQQYIGVFYDGGIVQPIKDPLPTIKNDVYSLQAVGMQYGISYKKLFMNMNLAKGVGTYNGYTVGNIESKPDNWRGNISISLAF